KRRSLEKNIKRVLQQPESKLDCESNRWLQWNGRLSMAKRSLEQLDNLLKWIDGQFPGVAAECAASSQESCDQEHQAEPSSHVKPSCLTDSIDLQLPSKYKDSDQSVYHVGSEVSHDEHAEALIRAPARAVGACMEQYGYDQEDSVVSTRTEESYVAGPELTSGSTSSHHEDDVFSQGARS